MRLALTLCVVIAFAFAVTPLYAASLPPTGLVLNEFMAGPASDWDGSGAFSSRDDEWVEFRNAGDLMLDLSEYFVTDGDSIPRFRFTGFLPAGDWIVVFGSDAYGWERDNGFPAFGLSLGNSGDAVLLWQVTGADTTLVDAYAYGSHEAAADRSVGRMLDTEAWALFDGLNPYSGSAMPAGTGCDPSPGELNACGATPVRSDSWGRLKVLYQ